MNDHREKRRPIAAAQWRAARAIVEGALPTRGRVAIILGCDESAAYARARKEGWKTLDFRSSLAVEAHHTFIKRVAVLGGESGSDAHVDLTEEVFADAALSATGSADVWDVGEVDDPFALLARAAKVLTRRVAALLSSAEAGGRINKAEIDGLLALARMIERWETLAKDRAKQEETQSDEEIARTLRTIDQRIVELARAEATRLVAGGDRAESGQAGSG